MKQDIVKESENDNTYSKEQIEEIQDTFIAIAGHKLLSPLTVIKWNLELLRKKIPDDCVEIVDDIEINSQKLHDLSSTLIKLAEVSLKTGEKNIVYESLNIYKIIQEILDEFEEPLTKNNLEVNFSVPEEMEYSIGLGADELREILRVVIQNSILYNKEAGIISIDSMVSNDYLNLIVGSTTLPISEDEINIIPSAFFRSKEAQLSEVKGNGLGLYYVKKILMTIDGKMTIHNKRGKIIVKLSLPVSNND